MSEIDISILLPDFRGGGAERVNLDLAHEFARMGYQVEFVVLQARGEFFKEARAAFPIVDLSKRRVRGVPFAFYRYLRTSRPRGVIAAMWPLTVVAPLAQLFCSYRASIVIAEHGLLSEQYRNWGCAHRLALRSSIAAAYRLADARVGVSVSVVDDMARLSAMDRGRFAVIHNPVPPPPQPSYGTMNDVAAMWGTPSGGRILTVGSLKTVKNQALLLHAFATLPRTDVRLMLVGAGPEEEKLRRLANDLGITQRVVFAGFRADPTPFYRTADLFVLSSEREGLPTVIIEALACGTAVVSTDCPSGPSEILAGGKYGTLVPIGDAEALAFAMGQALSRRHDKESLRARASDFAPEKAAKAYLDLLFPN